MVPSGATAAASPLAGRSKTWCPDGSIEWSIPSPVMKLALPSGPKTIGPATGAFPSKVQRTVALVERCSSTTDICAGAAVGVGVRVAHAGQESELTPTPTVTGCELIPLELALIQAQPSLRPVYCPPWLLVGG